MSRSITPDRFKYMNSLCTATRAWAWEYMHVGGLIDAGVHCAYLCECDSLTGLSSQQPRVSPLPGGCVNPWTQQPEATMSALLWQNSNLPFYTYKPQTHITHTSTSQCCVAHTWSTTLLFLNVICHSLVSVLLQAPSGLSMGLINASIVQNGSSRGIWSLMTLNRKHTTYLTTINPLPEALNLKHSMHTLYAAYSLRLQDKLTDMWIERSCILFQGIRLRSVGHKMLRKNPCVCVFCT